MADEKMTKYFAGRFVLAGDSPDQGEKLSEVIFLNLHQAKITYLVHSGFSVETTHSFLLFDYCPSLDSKKQVNGALLNDKAAAVYVFASHNHGDHFDPAIFQWAQDHPTITYILSSDIDYSLPNIKCQTLSPYENWSDRILTVKAYGSTDAGASFLVQVDGMSIFHAGDLNWWRWKGESPAEQEFADRYFAEELAKLHGQKIDLAFFPVDRRLEENFALGAEAFAAAMQPKLLIPMHFGRDFAATTAFVAKTAGQVPTVEINHKGQEFLFDLEK